MLPGDLVAERFELERVVGSGGMGTVFRAHDRAAGRTVALKSLSAVGAEDLERFAREAQLLAELRHPGIVGYVAHGDAPGGEPFLAMQWLEGEDLAARLGRGRLGVDECFALGVRVADALGAAHARGIVHRDVKPSNLWLRDGRADEAVVLDFGVARRALAAQPLTGTGVAVGTPSYMAPEQARGERGLDARVDVFSLGCVLWECLTGERAFTGEHMMAVLAKILFEEAPRASEMRPDAPPALDALLSRMLAKQAGARARARLQERAARIRDPALREQFLRDVPENALTMQVG